MVEHLGNVDHLGSLDHLENLLKTIKMIRYS